MSHNQERKEKNCLNCNAIVLGRYCQVCGQENIEPKESFWHLVKHLFEDLTHFDGKFFITMKDLLFRPGFLSREYLRGRRVTYLHPVRMYLFTSAVFFLIYFSFYQKEEGIKKDETGEIAVLKESKNLTTEREALVATLKDTLLSKKVKEGITHRIAQIDTAIAFLKIDTLQAKFAMQIITGPVNISYQKDKDIDKYTSTKQYDSIQKALPYKRRDGFFERKAKEQSIYLKEKYANDPQALFENLTRQLLHHFPQVLFISLPLMALLLQLMYIRHRKFLYVSHIIFTTHLYCAFFIIFLLNLWTGSLINYFFTGKPGWVNGIFFLVELVYGYLAMSAFYEQSVGKTILKYSIALMCLLMVMIALFLIFLIFSVFTI